MRFGSVLLWFVCLGLAAATLRVLALPIALVMPAMAPYLPDFGWAVAGHIVGGPVALALVPFQLSARLRGASLRRHRWLGYGYVLAVLVGAVAALALLPRFQGSAFAGVGFAMLAILWVGFTLRAVLAARAGDLAAHRRWMLRSVALTLAAVSLRLVMAPLMAAGWSLTETYDLTAWGSWLVNLALLEAVEYRRRTHPSEA